MRDAEIALQAAVAAGLEADKIAELEAALAKEKAEAEEAAAKAETERLEAEAAEVEAAEAAALVE